MTWRRSEEIASQLRQYVAAGLHFGILKRGSRLPSARELASRYDVHQRVVIAAYHSLEREGVVELRSRSGAYVAPAEAPAEPPAHTARWAADLFADGLARGIPVPDLPERLRRHAETLTLRAACVECNADLFQLHVGGTEEFFGWPDFFHDEESGEVKPVTDEAFCEELDVCPEFVLDDGFRQSLHVEPAVTELGYHTSANKFDFSTSEQFQHQGDIFVAETGSFVPSTGATELTGYKVVRVDPSGHESDFITHPAQDQSVIFNPDGFNKPIDVKFDGDAMLVVDFGVFEPGLGLMQQNSGKLWAVCHGAAACKKLAR